MADRSCKIPTSEWAINFNSLISIQLEKNMIFLISILLYLQNIRVQY